MRKDVLLTPPAPNALDGAAGGGARVRHRSGRWRTTWGLGSRQDAAARRPKTAPAVFPKAGRALRTAAAPQVLAADVFAGVVAREWSRGDRAGRAGSLVVVECPPGADGAAMLSPDAWFAVAQAARQAFGQATALGWLARGVVFGAVVPGGPEGLEQRMLDAIAVRGSVPDGRIRVGARACVRRGLACGAAQETAAAWVELLAPGRRQQATYRLKRCLDVAGSTVLLGLSLPLMTIVALAVRLTSPGPALYRQKRIGQGGRPFTMLKFRTMRAGAATDRHREFATALIRSRTGVPAGDGTVLFKLANDPQITPLGRLLRTTSIDELPQLWNVLRGEMSLVGPRPPLRYEVEAYQAWHQRRILEATPGMSGLWQVAGRSRTTFDEMVRLDLRYVRTCSLRTDLAILLATPRAVLSGQGAA